MLVDCFNSLHVSCLNQVQSLVMDMQSISSITCSVRSIFYICILSTGFEL